MGKSQGPKEALKEAQAGTPVAEKNFSSKKKEDKASGASKSSKGSLTLAIALPHVTDTGDGYENSYRDHADDSRAARRKGISHEQWEDSASDRLADKAGAKRMREEKETETEHSASYKAGVGAFHSKPKTSHGFGHPASARDGHLRKSGHSGAHQLGSKRK